MWSFLKWLDCDVVELPTFALETAISFLVAPVDGG